MGKRAKGNDEGGAKREKETRGRNQLKPPSPQPEVTLGPSYVSVLQREKNSRVQGTDFKGERKGIREKPNKNPKEGVPQ